MADITTITDITTMKLFKIFLVSLIILERNFMIKSLILKFTAVGLSIIIGGALSLFLRLKLRHLFFRP